MNSLRRRLFLLLVVATGLIWLCGFAWIAVGAKAELERVLDTRLQEAAKMVHSLVASGSNAAIAAAAGSPAGTPAKYERQLSCQIWSLDGHLLARSDSAPEALLTDRTSGFSDRVVNGETWRVYSIENTAKGVRIMIGDRLGLRDHLVADLIKGLMIPAVLIIPLLGGLIWVSLGRGLRPLREMAGELQRRDADDMRPIDARSAPTEIRPLTEALNGLFVRLERARQHEREVTAFAAHELRTPLAGLKTQAQIAMAAVDPAMRRNALGQILVSVDRTTRLVRQLLALAKLDAGMALPGAAVVSIGAVLSEMLAALPPMGNAIFVTVDPALQDLWVRADREMVQIALRNLHENAVQHTPEGGAISWGVASDGRSVVLEDTGPGIPEAELPLVCQRFFRGKQRSATGCGLGLALVETAIRKTGGILTLQNRADRSGLQVRIVWPPVCPVA